MMHVRVQGQALWVGEDAYPLSRVTSTRPQVERPPERSWTISRFIFLLLALAYLAITIDTSNQSALNVTLMAAGPIALPLLFLIGLYQLRAGLRRKTLHKLIIETASSRTIVVTSHDSRQISSLRKAIHNPRAEFAIQVENAHFGDKIAQYGDHNTGKRVGL
ncbi:DUF6232 family protein [Kitasatospora sp. NPDC004669]|uniref:DUF6232 family protein n=1 Tax=Kitasatospora sp. NPDC004669 TaxID=3154555 RepID=UPI0033BB168F